MSLFADVMRKLSAWLDPWLLELCVAQVATIFVIYGETLNRIVRKQLKPYPWFSRISIFILLNAFGYGIVTVCGAKLLQQVYGQASFMIRYWIVLAIFLLIGILAEGKKQI